jgi:small subunit ribosomal protein S24e
VDITILEDRPNPLLKRREYRFEVAHPTVATPSRDAVRGELSKLVKAPKDRVIIERMAARYGTATTRGDALVYETAEAAKSITREHILIRNGLREKETKGAAVPAETPTPEAPKAETTTESPKVESPEEATPAPKVEHKADHKSEHSPDAKPEHKSESKADHKPDSKPDHKPESKTEHPPESKADHKTEPKGGSKGDTHKGEHKAKAPKAEKDAAPAKEE